MTDLDTVIRARLGGYENGACCGGCGCEGNRCEVTGFDEMRGALAAMLDLHKKHDKYGKPLCWHCVYPMGGDNVDYPCDTVLAIAKAIGVGVPHDSR